jgi:hypothetical protein
VKDKEFSENSQRIIGYSIATGFVCGILYGGPKIWIIHLIIGCLVSSFAYGRTIGIVYGITMGLVSGFVNGFANITKLMPNSQISIYILMIIILCLAEYLYLKTKDMVKGSNTQLLRLDALFTSSLILINMLNLFSGVLWTT